jgi:hypothetical protein
MFNLTPLLIGQSLPVAAPCFGPIGDANHGQDDCEDHEAG